MSEFTADELRHAGTMWRYQDARGVRHIGHFVSFTDFGGTDCPYTFRDCATGELAVVGGQLLKAAGPVDHACEIRGRMLAAWR